MSRYGDKGGYEVGNVRICTVRENRAEQRSSPEGRAAIGAAFRGRPLSPEHRAKLSAARKGRPLSPEHRAAIAAANRRPEHRAAVSVAFRGRPMSPEARAKMSGRIQDIRDKTPQLQQDLQRLLAEQSAVEASLNGVRALRSSCRAWIDRLPPHTKLEPASTPTEGKTIGAVHARLKDARAELSKLRSLPTPSPDLKQRVEEYVARLGAPQVRGTGAGERLQVIWPGARQTMSGYDDRTADPLALFALLAPEKMTDAIMGEAQRMAGDVSTNAARMAELEHKIEQLAYIEQALAGDELIYPSLPQAVLGVKCAA